MLQNYLPAVTAYKDYHRAHDSRTRLPASVVHRLNAGWQLTEKVNPKNVSEKLKKMNQAMIAGN